MNKINNNPMVIFLLHGLLPMGLVTFLLASVLGLTAFGIGVLMLGLLLPFLIIYFYAPSLYSRYEIAREGLILLLVKLFNIVVMSVMYYLVLSPVAIVLRVSGRDRLGLRKNQAWKEPDPVKYNKDFFDEPF